MPCALQHLLPNAPGICQGEGVPPAASDNIPSPASASGCNGGIWQGTAPTSGSSSCRGPRSLGTPRPPWWVQSSNMAPFPRETLPRERLLRTRALESPLQLSPLGTQSQPDKSCLEEASVAAAPVAGGAAFNAEPSPCTGGLRPACLSRAPAPHVPLSYSHPALPPSQHRAPQGLRHQHPRSLHRSPGRSVARPTHSEGLPGATGVSGGAGLCPCMETNHCPHLGIQNTQQGGGIPHTSARRGPARLGTPLGAPSHTPWGIPGTQLPSPKCQHWAGCGLLALSPYATMPLPGRTWEQRARTVQGSSHAPGAHQLPPAETTGQMESAARPTTWLSKSRHLCCPEPQIPPLHLPWASLSAPKTCCRRGALPTRWPSWPASTTSYPLWWPEDRRSTATCPRGMSYHQPPAPQGVAGTPGAASGLRRADPCSVLRPRGAAGAPRTAGDAINFWGAWRSPQGVARN